MKPFNFLMSLLAVLTILLSCRQKPIKVTDSDFTIFDEIPILLDHVNLSKSNFNIGLYYIPSNASSQEYVQIRKIYPDSSFEVVESYERFSNGKIYAVSDTNIQFILIDTLWNEQKTVFDTISLAIKNLE